MITCHLQLLGVMQHYISARRAGADPPGGQLIVLPSLKWPGSADLQAKNCRTAQQPKTPTSISCKRNVSLCIFGYRVAFFALWRDSHLEPSMTSNSQSSQSTNISEHDDAEAKMRRALGLKSGAAGSSPSLHAARPAERSATDRPKSRFVQDGDVPVVMIRRDNGQHAAGSRATIGASPSMRMEATERSLKTERHAREAAERSLAEAQATIQDLQTKLGHAVLVRDEARANAQRVEIEKQALEHALAAEQDARQAAEQRLLDIVPTPCPTAVAETESAPSPPPADAKSKAKARPRGRSANSEPKPKPVKWWIKSK